MTKPRATASEQGWAHDGPWPEDNHWRVVYLETAIAITWTEADAVAIVQALKDRADQQAALTEALEALGQVVNGDRGCWDYARTVLDRAARRSRVVLQAEAERDRLW